MPFFAPARVEGKVMPQARLNAFSTFYDEPSFATFANAKREGCPFVKIDALGEVFGTKNGTQNDALWRLGMWRHTAQASDVQ